MRAALALVLSLALAGCALPPAADGPAPRYRALRAQILPPGFGAGGSVGFHVNRPAYVALFEVTPGAGSSLVYPSPGIGRMDGFSYAGLNTLPWLRRHNAETYHPAFGGMAGPRFFFLVASERPLNLAQFGSFGYGLRSAMGARFTSLNAYDAIEEIAELTLPTTAADGSWTSDLYVHWPQALERGGRAVLVRCNGYAVQVPVEFVVAAQATLCDPRRTEEGKPAQPAEPTDSASKAQPGRRAPLPKADADASLRARIAASAQLDEERAARAADPWDGRADRRTFGRERDRGMRAGTDDFGRDRARRSTAGGSQAAPRATGESVTNARPAAGGGAKAGPASRGGAASGGGAASSSGKAGERPSRPRPGGGGGA